jgi:hypothetical protein
MNAYNYSRTDIKGTARYMGMGGAFGALGGDISTLSQNPAGIGVYRSNEIVTTLGIAGISAETKTSVNVNNNLTKFVFDNVGIIGTFNTGKDLGIVSYNFGFAYNRRNSYDQTYRVQYSNLRSSVTNYIADKSFGIRENDLAGADVQSGDAYDINGLPWLSILGYESLLMSPQENPEGGYYDDSYEGLFGAKATGSGSLYVRERGRTNEYTFNFGGNVSNVVYFGIGLGIMDLDYEMISSHDENLFNTSGFVPKKEKIEEPDKYEIYNYPITASNFSLWNRLKTEGTGFNVKLGLIARVTDYWRLGLAFHTPTYYSMSDYYMASVDNAYTYVNTNVNETLSERDVTDSPEGRYDYSLVTPWKFMASTAFIIGKKGIVSFDYEYTAYDKMSLSETDGLEMNDVNDDISSYFKAGHTFRVGGEYRITPQLSARLGYANQLSPMKVSTGDALNIAGMAPHYTLDRGTQYYTCGLGYRFGIFYADMAYIHKNAKSDVLAFSPIPSTGLTSEVATLHAKNNSFILTLGFKF